MASYQLVTNAEEGGTEEEMIELSESVLLVQSEEHSGDLPQTFSSNTTFHDTISSSMASAGIGDAMMVGDSMIIDTSDGGTITTTAESASHLSSGDLEALVSFQAELDRIGTEIPETHDPSAQVEISVANFDPEESAAAGIIGSSTSSNTVYEEGVVIETAEYDSGIIGSYEESGGSTFTVADSQIICGGDVLHDVVVESSILPDIGPETVDTSDDVMITTSEAGHPIVVSMAPQPATVPATLSTAQKPIYLIPHASTVAMEEGAPIGQVLYTTASGSTGPVSVDTSHLITRALMDAKTLPASMHGKFLTVTSTGGGGGAPIIAKVMLASSSVTGPTGTQTMTFAPCSAVGPSGQQTVRLVSSSGSSLAATTSTAVGGRTYTLATPHSLMSPNKTRYVTTLPTTPNKQIMVSKIALGQKTPTKITMIPVSMGKSPQKIAPAPGSVPSIRPGRVIVVTSSLGGLTTSSVMTTAPKLGTVASSPSKLIFRQATGQRPATPRKGTVAALTQQTVVTSGASNHVVVTAAGTTVRMAVPVGSTAGGAIQVPGNKFPYIRLVTATTPSNATAIAGSRQAPGVRPVTLTTAARPIMLTTATRPIAPVPTSAASQVRMAVPIAAANTSTLIGQPMVAAKQMTVGGQQRIFIPASSVAQMRPSGNVGGASTITMPASALAHLGSSIFSAGGNIVMVPAQYMAQLQAQGMTTAVATSTLSTGPAIAPAPAKTAPLLLPAGPIPVAPSPSVTAPSIAPVVQESSSGEGERSLVSSQGLLPSKLQASNGVPFDPNGLRPRKPCNCTKSQCLKLYCDCFANGEFCHDCNCNNCSNNLEHEEERQKAIKSCLERNPQAFHPKIGKTFQGGRTRDGEIERRHNKGCNCKRSGCLKNYCECYEAKIMCSYMCKCVGCKNFAESADKKTLMHLADAAEVRVQQQTAVRSKLSSHMTHMVEVLPSKQPLGSAMGDRLPSTFITSAVVEATCQCLLAQAEDGRDRNMSEADVERNVIQEFSRCLLQIIDYASKTKV